MATYVLINDANQLEVTGAGNSSYNGIYDKVVGSAQTTTYGTDTILRYKYTKQGGTETIAAVVDGVGGTIQWYILDGPNGPTNVYYTPSLIPIDLNDSSTLSIADKPFGSFDSLDNPPPIVKIYTPWPAGRSLAEHLRYRLLGYI